MERDTIGSIKNAGWTGIGPVRVAVWWTHAGFNVDVRGVIRNGRCWIASLGGTLGLASRRWGPLCLSQSSTGYKEYHCDLTWKLGKNNTQKT